MAAPLALEDPMCMVLAFVLAVSCKQDAQPESDTMVSGTITPEHLELSGEVQEDVDLDFSGEVAGVRAFAYDRDGDFVAYISSNPSATCEIAGEFLDTDKEEAYDPADVWSGGKCSIYIQTWASVVQYDGGLSASRSADSEESDMVAAGTSIECLMGEGEVVYEERGEGDVGYYWSGPYWFGPPTAYAWDFSGGGGEDYTLEIEMTEYRGFLPYDYVGGVVPATGRVSGTVTASWCEDLAAVLPL